MKLKFAAQCGTSRWMPNKVVRDDEAMQYASAVHSSRNTSYPDYSGRQQLEPLRKQSIRRIPPPVRMQAAVCQRQGMLARVFAWLRGGLAPEKKLRVLETVPLGEKRLVAIVEAQGRRFLVGCGSNGVSLLTSLEQEQDRDLELDSKRSAGIAG